MGKKANFKREYTQMLLAHDRRGQSKHAAKMENLKAAKENNTPYQPVRGIYSTATLDTYKKACSQFSNFLRETHPEVKRFHDGQQYIAEWLMSMENSHSAWTLTTYAEGVCCAYSIQKSNIDFKFPQRKRENIIRSRDKLSQRDSAPKYADARLFCTATGARRGGITKVRKEDIRQRDDGTYEVFFREKNNISGWRQVLPEYQEEVLRIFRESPGYRTPNGEIRLFPKSALPQELHSCRAEYCCKLYEYYESQNTFSTGEIYYCRGNMKGLSFDKGILAECSRQMFHSRLDVIVSNYLYMFK